MANVFGLYQVTFEISSKPIQVDDFREMKQIVNHLEKRIFSLQINVQHSYQASDQSRKKSTIESPSFISPSIQQLNSQSNTPSSTATNRENETTSNDSLTQFPLLVLSSIESSPKQFKVLIYEFAAIFEDALDQVHLLHQTLNFRNINHNHQGSHAGLQQEDTNRFDTNCDPFTLNIAGISMY